MKTTNNKKIKLRKNDTVKIIAGKDKGKSGRILKIDRDNDRVIVQGLNIARKAVRKKSQQDKGGIIEIETPLHISNVAIVTKDGSTSRIGFEIRDGKKVRIAKKTGEVL
ncbi:MAG: 50S ribosomal protein L24 [Spirochaetales bacterium]|nr:50S ribosomal protein L24 [Spirochaetales bacterium]